MRHFCFSIRNALGRSLIFIFTGLVLSSCASVGGARLQPEINGLIAAGHVQAAADKIIAPSADYGTGNYVLYHLDRAIVLQLTGDFSASAASLEKAKARYDELYTHSVTNEASTWVVNDNMSPYRPAAYERVLMNVFQAFNYLQMNALNDALVEARDLDAKFPVITDAYAGDRHVFEDNGFARLLCGILYEASGTAADLNDALIAYQQALTVYDAYYGGTYVPPILQDSLIRLAQKFNDPELKQYRARFPDARGDRDRPDAARVYLLESVGFSPVKVSRMIPVPVDDGLVTKMAFPEFVHRTYNVHFSRILLEDAQGHTTGADTQLADDIEGLARKDLEARKAFVLAKAIARPALKYLVERNQKESIEKKHGPLAGELFGLFSSLYNFYTEQADVRSWQALPAQVRVARVQVPAGIYHVRREDLNAAGAVISVQDEGQLQLRPGQTYFLIRRSLQ